MVFGSHWLFSRVPERWGLFIGAGGLRWKESRALEQGRIMVISGVTGLSTL